MTLTNKGSELMLQALLSAVQSSMGVTDTGKSVPNGDISIQNNKVTCCFDTYKLNLADIGEQRDKIIQICLLDGDKHELARIPVQPASRVEGAGLIFNLNLDIGGLNG